MMEPIHWAMYHEGLRVYSGGEHVGTVPFDDLPALVVSIAQGLQMRPQPGAGYQRPPHSLTRMLNQGLAEESATHAPRTTTAIRAMRAALDALGP